MVQASVEILRLRFKASAKLESKATVKILRLWFKASVEVSRLPRTQKRSLSLGNEASIDDTVQG